MRDTKSVENYIRQGLLKRGLPAHVVEGFIVNFKDESGLRPGINELRPLVPGSRGGFGLYQLTGPRRVEYERFARERGVTPDNIDAQLDFMMQELGGSEARAARSILAAPDTATAAQAIVKDFLRPARQYRDQRMARYAGLPSPPKSTPAQGPVPAAKPAMLPEVAVAQAAPGKPYRDPMVSAPNFRPELAEAGAVGDILAPPVEMARGQPPLPGIQATPTRSPATAPMLPPPVDVATLPVAPPVTAPAPFVPAPVPAPTLAAAVPSPATMAPGGAGLGGLLSGLVSAFSAGNQQKAQAQAAADAAWQEQYSRTLGPSPVEVAMDMPMDTARINTEVPMLPGRERVVPQAPNKDDILASLFGPRRPAGRSMMG